MPASREATLRKSSDASVDMLSVRAEGDLENRRTVYFTDQNPEFKISATNISDSSLSGSVIARVEFDESEEVFGEEFTRVWLDLEPGESTTEVLSPEIMSYQGHAAVRIDKATFTESNGKYDYETKKSAGKSRWRIYTFMVYDRDYYRVNYLQPRYAQYSAAILSVLIVAVGIIQITGWTP